MSESHFNQIAIVGLGYVGLPLCIRFCESGINVIGLDVDQDKVDAINDGKSYIKHIDSVTINKLTSERRLKASTKFEEIRSCDAILICVPTPLGQHREPDISYVLETGKSIARYLKADSSKRKKLVVLESTTYPGTTDENLREVLETCSGLVAGQDFHLAYSPEREDPGSVEHSVKSIPKVMGGYTPECLSKCVDLYSIAVDEVYPVSSTRLAEATKLTENIFRCVNIALVNELKMVYEKMDINVWEVIEAAATKPFGFMPFYPGPGLGGHCIPIDPFYLSWKAKEFDFSTKFIELAGEINSNMPMWISNKILENLNLLGKSIKLSKILILGLTYKKNVNDLRESPSIKILELLKKYKTKLYFNDPYFNKDFNKAKFFKMDYKKLKNFDCVVLLTDHDVYDYKKILSNSNLIFDTRGKFQKNKKIVISI